MRHLTLSALYTNATIEASDQGIHLTWRNGRMLELKKLGFQPDAFLIATGARVVAGFVEFTSAFPDAKDLQAKIKAYEQYVQGRHCMQELCGGDGGRPVAHHVTEQAAELHRGHRAVGPGGLFSSGADRGRAEDDGPNLELERQREEGEPAGWEVGVIPALPAWVIGRLIPVKRGEP